MRPGALALCFVLLGVSIGAHSFEPRSTPSRQRSSSTPSMLAPDLVLDQRLVQPKVIALWDETR